MTMDRHKIEKGQRHQKPQFEKVNIATRNLFKKMGEHTTNCVKD
jgi:hypothetical protein